MLRPPGSPVGGASAEGDVVVGAADAGFDAWVDEVGDWIELEDDAFAFPVSSTANLSLRTRFRLSSSMHR
jgi:hypothetical protein